MKSIRGRLLMGLLGGCLAVLGTAGWIIYWLTSEALLSGVDARLRVEALAIIQQTWQEPDNRKPDGRDLDVFFADRLLPEFQRGGREFYQVRRGTGETEERSDSLESEDLPLRTGSLKEPVFWSFELADGRSVRGTGIEFVPHSWPHRRKHHDPSFTATVVVAGDLGQVAQTLGTVRNILISVGVFAFLAVLAGVPSVVWKSFRPLDRLSEDAAALDASRLNYRFKSEGLPTELHPIVARLNELFARLETAFDRERRFSADAAHELRTPLAELRSLAEIALKWPPSPAETRTAFEDTLAIARKLEVVVAGLLAIARSETGATIGNRSRVDLAALVRGQARRLSTDAERKNVQINIHAPDRFPVSSDAALLHTIVANLFDNAVEYSVPGGEIRLKLERLPDGTGFFSMSNPAPDLSPEDIPLLFDRFWRKEISRSDSKHSGLGLSVVGAAATALGLTVVPGLSPPDRLVITMTGLQTMESDSTANRRTGGPANS